MADQEEIIEGSDCGELAAYTIAGHQVYGLLWSIDRERSLENWPKSLQIFHICILYSNYNYRWECEDKHNHIIYFLCFQHPFHLHLSSRPMLLLISSVCRRPLLCPSLYQPCSTIWTSFTSPFWHACFTFIGHPLMPMSSLADLRSPAKPELFSPSLIVLPVWEGTYSYGFILVS